jgi:hypothetical protein
LIALGGEIADREAVDQDIGHQQQTEQGDNFCDFPLKRLLDMSC